MVHSPHDTNAAPAVSTGGAAMRVLLPLLAACAITWQEPALGHFAQDRPGIIPVVLLALVVGLISPGSRRWLVSTLCFGAGLMALRDAVRAVHLPASLPPALRAPLYVDAYAFSWIVLAALACAAAVGEALFSGAVWPRRCYFLAVALYFTGHGVLSYMKEPTWHSPVLVLVGVAALAGAWFADRMVEAEQEPEPFDDDLRAIANRSSERSATLTRREWVE